MHMQHTFKYQILLQVCAKIVFFPSGNLSRFAKQPSLQSFCFLCERIEEDILRQVTTKADAFLLEWDYYNENQKDINNINNTIYYIQLNSPSPGKVCPQFRH